MFPNEAIEDVHATDVALIPCSICSSLFDPATLPSHVYDPYRTFFSFPGHATLCSSCFAEELARRTRPPSSNPSPVPPSQPVGTEGGVSITQDDGGGYGRSQQPEAGSHGFHMSRGAKSLDLIRPSTSHGERRHGNTKPNATPPMSDHQERSDSAFAAPSSLSRQSSSRSASRQKHQGHRKASSVTTISRNPSVSKPGSSSDAATVTAGSRSVSGSTFASVKTQSHGQHKKSSSSASLNYSGGSAKASLERAREFKSQEILGSGQSIGSDLRRTASLGRERAKTPLGEAHAIALPPPPTGWSNHKRTSSSDASAIGSIKKSGGETGSGVKRSVSFRQGAPASKSYNPQSPPSRGVGITSPLVEGSESGSGSAGNGSALNIPGLLSISSGIGGLNVSTGVQTELAAVGSDPEDVVDIFEEGASDSGVRRGFWSRWREKRRREREQKDARREVRKERQLQRRQREDAEKGIGLELFCSHCRVVVRTVPRWREGSCCFLSAGCLLLCTGPFTLCLLLPCAAHQVMDVDGQCPNCDSVLSHWNRRKNLLTVHTWAGVAGDTAPPLTGEGIVPTTIIVPGSSSGGIAGVGGPSTGIGIPLVPLAAIQGQLASSPLSPTLSNPAASPSRPHTAGRPSSSRTHSLPQTGPGGGVLGGVLVLAQDIPTSAPRSSSAGGGSRHPFDPPPLPSLPPGLRPGAVAPTRHLRTPSNTSASMTYVGGNTNSSSDPATSSPSTGRSYGHQQHHRRQPSLTYSASISGNAASSSSGQPPSNASQSTPGSVQATPRSIITNRTGASSSARVGPIHARNISMSTSNTGRARNSGDGSNSGSGSGRGSIGSNAGGSGRERDSGGSGSLPPVGEGEVGEGVVELDSDRAEGERPRREGGDDEGGGGVMI